MLHAPFKFFIPKGSYVCNNQMKLGREVHDSGQNPFNARVALNKKGVGRGLIILPLPKLWQVCRINLRVVFALPSAMQSTFSKYEHIVFLKNCSSTTYHSGYHVQQIFLSERRVYVFLVKCINDQVMQGQCSMQSKTMHLRIQLGCPIFKHRQMSCQRNKRDFT